MQGGHAVASGLVLYRVDRRLVYVDFVYLAHK
jgi:hypothetical protein